VELLEDDGLSLDFADLFGDDPLGHFLENEEALLDDLNGLAAADHFLLLLYDDLCLDFTAEVIGAIEVVEVREGRDSTPVIEGVRISSSNGSNFLSARLKPWQGLRRDTSDDSRNSEDFEKLGKHFGKE